MGSGIVGRLRAEQDEVDRLRIDVVLAETASGPLRRPGPRRIHPAAAMCREPMPVFS